LHKLNLKGLSLLAALEYIAGLFTTWDLPDRIVQQSFAQIMHSWEWKDSLYVRIYVLYEMRSFTDRGLELMTACPKQLLINGGVMLSSTILLSQLIPHNGKVTYEFLLHMMKSLVFGLYELGLRGVCIKFVVSLLAPSCRC
jgi:hypothetical protein